MKNLSSCKLPVSSRARTKLELYAALSLTQKCCPHLTGTAIRRTCVYLHPPGSQPKSQNIHFLLIPPSPREPAKKSNHPLLTYTSIPQGANQKVKSSTSYLYLHPSGNQPKSRIIHFSLISPSPREPAKKSNHPFLTYTSIPQVTLYLQSPREPAKKSNHPLLTYSSIPQGTNQKVKSSISIDFSINVDSESLAHSS